MGIKVKMSSDTSFPQLMELLNKTVSLCHKHFEIFISELITTTKEVGCGKDRLRRGAP
jgi:hypothetical protein